MLQQVFRTDFSPVGFRGNRRNPVEWQGVLELITSWYWYWLTFSNNKLPDEIFYKKTGQTIQDQSHCQAQDHCDQEFDTNDFNGFITAWADRKHGVQLILAQTKRQDNDESQDKQGSNTYQDKYGTEDCKSSA